MQQKRVRWGILGTARIADWVLKGMRLSTNCEVVAVASRDAPRAKEWANERGIPLTFGSYEAMLQSDAVDAVYIPLPNALHKEWTIRAAHSGKHVLCEKPLARNAAEAEEIIKAGQETGVKIMEAFMYRFHPQIALIKRALDDGEIGDLKIIRATFEFLLTRPLDVRWNRELGGGSLMDVGCYCVNIARLLAGGEPLAATAAASMSPGGVDASLVGTLEFPGGVLCEIDCSFQAPMLQRLVLSGMAGHIEVPAPFRAGEGEAEFFVESGIPPTRRRVAAPASHEYHPMVEQFAADVLSDRPPRYSLADSLGNMRALDALASAARTGSRVQIGG